MQSHPGGDSDPQETAEWLESLEYVIDTAGERRAAFLLEKLHAKASSRGVRSAAGATTPYVNTIPAHVNCYISNHADVYYHRSYRLIDRREFTSYIDANMTLILGSISITPWQIY